MNKLSANQYPASIPAAHPAPRPAPNAAPARPARPPMSYLPALLRRLPCEATSLQQAWADLRLCRREYRAMLGDVRQLAQQRIAGRPQTLKQARAAAMLAMMAIKTAPLDQQEGVLSKRRVRERLYACAVELMQTSASDLAQLKADWVLKEMRWYAETAIQHHAIQPSEVLTRAWMEKDVVEGHPVDNLRRVMRSAAFAPAKAKASEPLAKRLQTALLASHVGVGQRSAKRQAAAELAVLAVVTAGPLSGADMWSKKHTEVLFGCALSLVDHMAIGETLANTDGQAILSALHEAWAQGITDPDLLLKAVARHEVRLVLEGEAPPA
ncbi:MAG: hypothetical protein IBJ04_03555 [Hydrogenophaga sp.]|nr:hypothetical protein [Hydrogenophaga sp.]MBL0943397.1 hypothetical protein [Hydrogenophaga sp.]